MSRLGTAVVGATTLLLLSVGSARAESEPTAPKLVVIGTSTCSGEMIAAQLKTRLPRAIVEVDGAAENGDLVVRVAWAQRIWSLTLADTDDKRLLQRRLRATRVECAEAALASAFVVERYLRGIHWPGLTSSVTSLPKLITGAPPPKLVVVATRRETLRQQPTNRRATPWSLALRLQLARGITGAHSQFGAGVDVSIGLTDRVRVRVGADGLLPGKAAVAFEDPLGGARSLGSVTFASLGAFAGLGVCTKGTKLRLCADALIGGQLFYARAIGDFLYKTQTDWAPQGFGAAELSATRVIDRWRFGVYVRGIVIAPTWRFAVEGVEANVLRSGPAAVSAGGIAGVIF